MSIDTILETPRTSTSRFFQGVRTIVVISPLSLKTSLHDMHLMLYDKNAYLPLVSGEFHREIFCLAAVSALVNARSTLRLFRQSLPGII